MQSGHLSVTEEEVVFTQEDGGSVLLTKVTQDRGVSWLEAWTSFEKAKRDGRDAAFMKSKNVPVGFPHIDEYRL